jgi:DNA topoisomerase IB
LSWSSERQRLSRRTDVAAVVEKFVDLAGRRLDTVLADRSAHRCERRKWQSIASKRAPFEINRFPVKAGTGWTLADELAEGTIRNEVR